jgi:hypothetical protein
LLSLAAAIEVDMMTEAPLTQAKSRYMGILEDTSFVQLSKTNNTLPNVNILQHSVLESPSRALK